MSQHLHLAYPRAVNLDNQFVFRHLRVVKRTRDGRTDLVVEEVRGEERVTEVARLLGGEKAGDPVRQSDYARELLRQRAASSGSV